MILNIKDIKAGLSKLINKEIIDKLILSPYNISTSPLHFLFCFCKNLFAPFSISSSGSSKLVIIFTHKKNIINFYLKV